MRAIRRGLDRDLDPQHPDPWLSQVSAQLFFCKVLFDRLAKQITPQAKEKMGALLCDLVKTMPDKEKREQLSDSDAEILLDWRSLNRWMGLLGGEDWEGQRWQEQRRDDLINLWNTNGEGKWAPIRKTMNVEESGLHLRYAVVQVAQQTKFRGTIREY